MIGSRTHREKIILMGGVWFSPSREQTSDGRFLMVPSAERPTGLSLETAAVSPSLALSLPIFLFEASGPHGSREFSRSSVIQRTQNEGMSNDRKKAEKSGILANNVSYRSKKHK